jgi:hypothetical protein
MARDARLNAAAIRRRSFDAGPAAIAHIRRRTIFFGAPGL